MTYYLPPSLALGLNRFNAPQSRAAVIIARREHRAISRFLDRAARGLEQPKAS